MPGETKAIRDKTRRAKDLSISKAIQVLEHPEWAGNKELYKDTYLTILKNSVPRATAITDTDGEDKKIIYMPVELMEKNEINTSTESDSKE